MWEEVTEGGGDETDRMAVNGGWLYRNKIWDFENEKWLPPTMVFVPQEGIRA